jgi:hypothetical protein
MIDGSHGLVVAAEIAERCDVAPAVLLMLIAEIGKKGEGWINLCHQCAKVYKYTSSPESDMIDADGFRHCLLQFILNHSKGRWSTLQYIFIINTNKLTIKEYAVVVENKSPLCLFSSMLRLASECKVLQTAIYRYHLGIRNHLISKVFGRRI